MGKTKPVKKRKVEVVFDAKKRKDFLTGFRKRKNERRKRAKEQLDNALKEEKKRIRLQVADGLKHMKKSFEPLKELTEEDKRENEYEDDDVKVKIVELSSNELAAQNYFIGPNRGVLEESEDGSATEEESEDDINKIPGMSLVDQKKVNECENINKGKTNKPPTKDLKTKKDIDHFKKTKILNKLKKSKLFKMKERLDNKANQKKLRRDRNNTIKSLPKSGLRKTKKAHAVRFRKGRMLSRKVLKSRRSAG